MTITLLRRTQAPGPGGLGHTADPFFTEEQDSGTVVGCRGNGITVALAA